MIEKRFNKINELISSSQLICELLRDASPEQIKETNLQDLSWLIANNLEEIQSQTVLLREQLGVGKGNL